MFAISLKVEDEDGCSWASAEAIRLFEENIAQI